MLSHFTRTELSHLLFLIQYNKKLNYKGTLDYKVLEKLECYIKQYITN